MAEMNKNWEIARQELNNANIVDDLDSYFGKDTWGSHELCDRTHLFLSMWDEHVLNHPSSIINKDLYEKAHELFDLMGVFYNLCIENDASSQEIEEAEMPINEVEIEPVIEREIANDWDEREPE